MRYKLLLTILLALLVSSSALADPSLMIKEPYFDFGYAPQNSTIGHTYWLYSNGMDTLHITKIKPGCGCTKAPLLKDIIAAGDSTELEIIYSTRQYYGPQSKRPSISSNEGDIQKYLQFTANIYRNPDSTFPVVITPYRFDVSQFGEKARTKMTFEIKNVSDSDLAIAVVDYPKEILKVEFPKKIDAQKTKKGKIEVRKSFSDLEFEKSITIEMNDVKKTRFTIPVRRIIRIPGK